MRNLYFGKDSNKIYWVENKSNNTGNKCQFMLIRIIIVIAGRSVSLCEILEKEGKREVEVNKVLRIGKGTLL